MIGFYIKVLPCLLLVMLSCSCEQGVTKRQVASVTFDVDGKSLKSKQGYKTFRGNSGGIGFYGQSIPVKISESEYILVLLSSDYSINEIPNAFLDEQMPIDCYKIRNFVCNREKFHMPLVLYFKDRMNSKSVSILDQNNVNFLNGRKIELKQYYAEFSMTAPDPDDNIYEIFPWLKQGRFTGQFQNLNSLNTQQKYMLFYTVSFERSETNHWRKP